MGSAYTQQQELSLGLDYRPRMIIDMGYSTPKLKDIKTPTYFTQRSRINALYRNEKLETYFSLQDVRYWGGDNMYKSSGTQGNSESVSLHQAWFLLKLNKNFRVKTGRQLFQYDDQRVLASRDWNDYQVSYDAVLLQVHDSLTRMDIGLTWNRDGSSNKLYPDELYRVFDFVHLQREIYKLKLSAIILVTGKTLSDTAESVFLKGTYGLNLEYKKGSWNARTTGYYQNILNNEASDITAWCFSFFGQGKLLSMHSAIGLGVDYLSGQDATNTDASYLSKNHQFDILWGKRHGWYGYMDYFNSTPAQGLVDYYAKFEYSGLPKLVLQADYHYFRLAADRFDTQNQAVKSDKGLGHEVDLTAKWKISNEVNLQAGYSFYLTTNTLEQIKKVNGAELKFPQFAYLKVVVKPEFKIFR